MTKSVSDSEFQLAIKNPNNINIIRRVCNQYSGLLSEDILKRCGLHGLWLCLAQHDDQRGNKFTTSLFRFVNWQCQQHLKRSSITWCQLNTDIVDDSPAVLESMMLREYVEKLPPHYHQVIYGKFYENKTFAEIAREMKCSRQNVRELYDRAISQIRNMHFE